MILTFFMVDCVGAVGSPPVEFAFKLLTAKPDRVRKQTHRGCACDA